MGHTFINLQIQSSSKSGVVTALKKILKAPAYVSRSEGGWISAYPEEGERVNLVTMDRLAKLLSASLETHVFVIFDYHSDVFIFSLFTHGNLVGHYDSFPDFFVFDPDDEDAPKKESFVPIANAAVLPFCRSGVTEDEVRRCLYPEQRPTFVEDQIAEFSRLLGISEDRTIAGFKDVRDEATDLDNDAEQITLIEIEDLPQEYWNEKLFEIDVIQKPEKMRLALENGADPNARSVMFGITPLQWYSAYCSTVHMKILIDAGADVNILGTRPFANSYAVIFEQVTPLMLVASRSIGHPTMLLEAAHLLIDAGADVNARSSTGRTALEMAEILTDWTKQQEGGIGRVGPEEVFRAAAARSAQLVELLKRAGAAG